MMMNSASNNSFTPFAKFPYLTTRPVPTMLTKARANTTMVISRCRESSESLKKLAPKRPKADA